MSDRSATRSRPTSRLPGPPPRWPILRAGALAAGLALLACAPGEEAQSPPAETPEAEGEVRVYVADRYEGVFQLDPDTLEVVDRIEVGLRPHGLLPSPDGGLLYVTLETTNELLKIDVATHEVLARAEVGPVPNEPTITLDGRYVFVPQRGGDHCDVVDTETMTVVKSLPVGEEEHNAYTCADGDHVYVTSMGDELIAVIDPEALEITRKVPMGGIPRPVALTEDESVAYVALSGLLGFVVWDLRTDEIVDRVEIPVPPGTPPPLLDTYTHGLLLTPDERELWTASYAIDAVHAFTVPDLEPLAEITVGQGPHWFALHPSGEPLYVSVERDGAVAAIHRGLRSLMRKAPAGQAPTRIVAFRTPAG